MLQNTNQINSYFGTPGCRIETFTPDQLIAGNLKIVSQPEIFAEAEDIILPRGTVVGRVTATNKLVICVKTATDGSQTPCGITADKIDVSAGDVTAQLYVQAEINAGYVSADDSWDTQSLKAAFLSGPGNIYLKDSLSNEILVGEGY
ncbi:head decoration protein [Acetobacteraceae bacterium]|nr:head decoration protein [Acetobacteraceae bacterium]